jgi:teichuronic acid biosynthesis glycosyltransferase TuaC
VRALIVTNMWPSEDDPALGRFVADQVAALRTLPDLDVEVFAFPPGGYARAARQLRRRYRATRFDVVHAHFGLSAWPALAIAAHARAVTLHGTDLRHPRSRLLTRAVLGRQDLIGVVSEDLADALPTRVRSSRRVAVLPCGVDMQRFRPLSRREARERLGLPPQEPCLLFPADPARPLKRADRARELAGHVRLMTLGRVDPEEVPYYVNAANAVLVPSEQEGFGLAVLEALACDVPVLATPTGVHAAALAGVGGALCAPYDRAVWAAALAPHLAAADPRIAGRAHAEPYSAVRMAERVATAWRGLGVNSPTEAPHQRASNA